VLDNAKENSIATRGDLLVRDRDHPIAKTSRAWDAGACVHVCDTNPMQI